MPASPDALPPLSVTLPQAADAIQRAQTIVMACHVSPDGDALGSMLGLALALAPMGKSLTLLAQDGVPAIYQFLPQKHLIQSSTECAHFDLALVLDCGDLARVGDRVMPMIARAKIVVDIDHHAVAGAFGDIQVLDTQVASTSEIVYALLQTLGLPLTSQIATCLFTGVTTDTGSFRYQNVSPRTLRVAADLVEAGARPADISEQVFENKTFAATRLLGHALSSLSETEGRRIVWAHITAQDFLALQAADEDTEGIVGPVRGVRGADVGILFREMPAPDGKPSIRISLRSRPGINVALVAQQFGGGGHALAAGCTVALPLADAEGVVVDAVRRVLPPL